MALAAVREDLAGPKTSPSRARGGNRPAPRDGSDAIGRDPCVMHLNWLINDSGHLCYRGMWGWRVPGGRPATARYARATVWGIADNAERLELAGYFFFGQIRRYYCEATLTGGWRGPVDRMFADVEQSCKCVLVGPDGTPEASTDTNKSTRGSTRCTPPPLAYGNICTCDRKKQTVVDATPLARAVIAFRSPRRRRRERTGHQILTDRSER
ncbi:hypothetical protein GEV33_000641 [Tenebrio molitor]|uniref:Uncharacterized protein n=1 Tax=Tenebrio molitor TaxID=7067 RepID=A0A8J6HWU1_TENMO|nr:hypothetical protein GEV33_000641 [Tenebrio molitor]